jgi:hypothetical protein
LLAIWRMVNIFFLKLMLFLLYVKMVSYFTSVHKSSIEFSC